LSMSTLEKAEGEADEVMKLLEAAMERNKFPKREGIWCKVFGLARNTEMNGKTIHVLREELTDGLVTVKFEIDRDSQLRGGEYTLYPKNLAPLPGATKVGKWHKQKTFKVSGISNDGDKKSVIAALQFRNVEGGTEGVVGVDEVAVKIVHDKVANHDVTIGGAFEEKAVTEAIQESGKYKVESFGDASV